MAGYKEILTWAAVGVGAAPIWGAGLWVMWRGVVRPYLVPRGEIEELAAVLIERYGEDAEEVAYANEYGAWRNSDNFAQGKWRRVRRSIRTRQRNAHRPCGGIANSRG